MENIIFVIPIFMIVYGLTEGFKKTADFFKWIFKPFKQKKLLSGIILEFISLILLWLSFYMGEKLNIGIGMDNPNGWCVVPYVFTCIALIGLPFCCGINFLMDHSAEKERGKRTW
jgi:hypothetical protein